MKTDQQIWQTWVRFLHQLGVAEFVASFLEAVGSLSILGAQVVYISQPLLNLFFPEEHLDALARLLEYKAQRQSFISLLREETQE